jgi:D-alanyl-D-alanine carboxypeptidase
MAAAELPAEPAASEEVEIALAAADPVEAAPPVAVEPGTLEAQVALLEDPVAADAAAPVVDPALDPALAEAKPKLRPETMAETAVAAAEVEAETPVEPAPVVVAEATPEPELVVTDPGPDVTRAEDPTLLIAGVSDVETVAGQTDMAPPAAELAAATVTAPQAERKAPIFDTVEVAEAPVEEAQEEVVVVMSSSGGRHFGVNVGEYPSRYEAERALLKTALAESATLDGGLRKTSQSGGVWRASFMGLTEEQADLACRRLSARAIPCETVGG